ncbi:LPS export ABC transporter periplasmic protein LptC [Maritalea mobilis]|uniref:LPS export ABC transporter periplasmic protein LptC n=1 Tax=Maritalea mobilis TaxID=483324 RepID=UPI001C97DE66|nr:LPS export ABC transporter periplasmic protein LptC [Maritalea mobilis]MBY6201533.1 LPS export ABC transporter periplasmic protein LptC [Maritalea mobilis]
MASGSRYSTVVMGLKLTLPLAALALLSTLFLFSNPPDPEQAIPYAEVDVEELAREQRLTQPRFAGVLEDGRELTLVADAATPSFDADRTRTEAIATENVSGRMALPDGDVLTLDAASGYIDLAGQVADLFGGVTATTELGYRLVTEEIHVLLAQTGLSTDTDVEITGPGITLTAGAMEVTGPSEGAVVSFTGGVRLLYQPEN